jgi:hypothetical protein
MIDFPSALHIGPWNPKPRPAVAPKRCSGTQIPSLAVELDDGAHRMIELSDDVDSKFGSVDGDQVMFVTPASWPMRSASRVILYRDGLPLASLL